MFIKLKQNETPRSKLRGIKLSIAQAQIAASCGELTPQRLENKWYLVNSKNRWLNNNHKIVDLSVEHKS